jgi:glycosyltransferase involved in cell wall biosynthesis
MSCCDHLARRLGAHPGTAVVIVGFGTYDASRHPRVGILLDGLRERGFEVVEVNHPLGLSTAERVRMLRQPWRLPAFAWRIASRWRLLAKEARALRQSPVDAVLIGYLGHFDVLLARLVFPRSYVVLDHLVFAGDTASDRGARGLRVGMLRGLDRIAIALADLVVVDTPEHARLLPSNADGVVVPVGAREEWFLAANEPARDEPDDAPLSVVFFGLFTPLQGAAVIARAIAAAIEAGASISATMIGTGQDWEAARRELGERSEVTWIDWVSPEDLPALVAAHDVCLGIFGDSPKALRVVPNKVFEGAAAGCAIITSDTPPQRTLLGDAARLVAPADAPALARELIKLAGDRAAVRAGRAEARALADGFRAERVVGPLVTRIEEQM